MFFILSKTAGYLILPSNFLVALGVLGLVFLLARRRRVGKMLIGVSVVLLLLLGYLPVGPYLGHLLEQRFPIWDATRGEPTGFIVLGGAIDPLMSRLRGQTAISGSATRVTVIAKLARDYPNARIVFTSGDASLLGNYGSEADYLLPLLETFGVPPERVTLERRARNTVENAAFTKALIQPKPGERWVLVTSAQHMPRAIGCFRRIGFPVEAYPVDWKTYPRFRFAPMGSLADGLYKTDNAVHEWLGLFFYWLTGRTSELLPGP